MLADLQLAGEERTRRLRELEKGARRKGHTNAANNIALTLARETEDDDEATNILSSVLTDRDKSSGFYNQVRAILEIVERKVEAETPLSDGEIAQLIACYQFLLNERVPSLFNKAHRALWHAFIRRSNWENLLTLFRYSSMIWRLRGEEYREEKLLQDLDRLLGSIPPALVSQHKVSHYYYARSAHHFSPKSPPNQAAPSGTESGSQKKLSPP